MKKVLVVFVGLVCMSSLQSSIGSGFGKIWDGTKDVVSGTFEVVAAPFRGNGEDGKTAKKDKKKKESPAKSTVSKK